MPHGALVEDRHTHRLQLVAHQVGLLVLQLLAEPPPPREERIHLCLVNLGTRGGGLDVAGGSLDAAGGGLDVAGGSLYPGLVSLAGTGTTC